MFVLLIPLLGKAQDTTAHRRNAAVFAASGLGVVYAGSMATLYKTWYSNYTFEKFHFFNDNPEWKGLDKAGHFTTSWWAASWVADGFELSGMRRSKAALWGVFTPLAFTTTIEVFDGFSSGWGFSWGDMLANASGSAVFYLQERVWKEQRILFRFSCRNTRFAPIRPKLLGAGIPERWLKDYNGQTYWISYPLKRLAGNAGWVPSWLNVAIGSGASGMLGGRTNTWIENGVLVDYSKQPRYRQWYLSLDVDLKKLPIKGKAWKFIASSVGWLKIPFPTIGWDRIQGVGFYPLYP